MTVTDHKGTLAKQTEHSSSADEVLATMNFNLVCKVANLLHAEDVGPILRQKECLIDNFEAIDEIIGFLADERSRDSMRALVRYHLYSSTSRKKDVIESIREEVQWPSESIHFYLDDDSKLTLWNDENQYLPPDLLDVFDFSENETFADIGSFNGANIWQFHKKLGGKYRNIFAFEPSRHHYTEVLRMVKPIHDDRVRVFNCGLSSEEQTVYFPRSMNPAAKGSLQYFEGSDACHFKPIEAVLTPEEIASMSIVKMDTEGAELDILKSLGPHISRSQPRLIVSLYHRMSDLYTIPRIVRELVPDRKIYIRHHTNWFLETVLYAL